MTAFGGLQSSLGLAITVCEGLKCDLLGLAKISKMGFLRDPCGPQQLTP